jgi:hypothetical protein
VEDSTDNVDFYNVLLHNVEDAAAAGGTSELMRTAAGECPAGYLCLAHSNAGFMLNRTAEDGPLKQDPMHGWLNLSRASQHKCSWEQLFAREMLDTASLVEGGWGGKRGPLPAAGAPCGSRRRLARRSGLPEPQRGRHVAFCRPQARLHPPPPKQECASRRLPSGCCRGTMPTRLRTS